MSRAASGKRPRAILLGSLLASIVSFCPLSRSVDWPQFLGPTRNGISTETNLATAWPKDGPPIVWQKKVGEGFSGPVVADGKLILFHRVGDAEVVECFEAKTGKALWKVDYPTSYQDDFDRGNGPRATPAIADSDVYSFGVEGMLTCWKLAAGEKVWRVDTKKQFGASK